MKKLSTIIMALALVLGMSQCKKQETTDPATPSNPGVRITVNVGDQDGKDGKDNNGEKHNIAPDYGLFAFTKGDVLYVGHHGKYVGKLTFNGACFDGTIYPDANATDKLHFYFLGNAAVTGTTTEGETTSLSISIADQSGNLPVLSYGPSEQNYSDANTSYSATLKNKCALVKLSLSHPTTGTVTLSGVPTVATVNFADPTNAIVATNLEDLHDITLRYVTTWNPDLRWVILLPGTDLADVVTVAEGVESVMANNTHITSGLTLNNPVALPNTQYAVHTAGDNPVLTQFSVSGDKKVYFSKANLRYDESSKVWSFHDNQFDGCIGQVSGSYPQGYNVSLNGTKMDRFSWGFHSPTTTGESDYVDGSTNLDVNETDWGCVFKAAGYNEGTNWRTLTSAEWNYLLNSRGNKSFMKVTLGTLNITDPNTNTTYNGLFLSGLFIAPDNFDPSKYSFTSSFANKTWNNAKCQGLGIDDANTLLAAGCVFLPALGYRDENGYQDYYPYSSSPTNTNFAGYYWSATGGPQNPGSSQAPKAEALKFDYYGNTMPSNNAQFRNLGMCVRLVWDAN